MPIDDIKAAQVINAYGGHKDAPPKHKKRDLQKEDEDPCQEDETIHDETSILGISPDELTENVRHAITQLMAEIEELRLEISHSQALENMISDTMDHHRDLSVLTRHALMREVTLCLHQLENDIRQACFVYLQMTNFEHIKNQWGLGAYDSIYRQCADITKQYLRQTDKIGTIAGDGFGVLMALSDIEDCRAKLESICARIENLPILWEMTQITVKPQFGISELQKGMKALDVLKLADQDLRQKKILFKQ